MKIKEKYYIECNLDLIVEVSDEDKEKVMKKINGIISSVLKNETVLHLSKNINLTSESDIFLSMAKDALKDIN